MDDSVERCRERGKVVDCVVVVVDEDARRRDYQQRFPIQKLTFLYDFRLSSKDEGEEKALVHPFQSLSPTSFFRTTIHNSPRAFLSSIPKPRTSPFHHLSPSLLR